MQIDFLLKKVHYTNQRGVIINAPSSIEEAFTKLGFSKISRSDSNFTILFINNKKEAELYIKSSLEKTDYYSLFWIAYPKSTSSIKTDINRDKLWSLLKPYGYQSVSMVALYKNWSIMRIRPIEKEKQRC